MGNYMDGLIQQRYPSQPSQPPKSYVPGAPNTGGPSIPQTPGGGNYGPGVPGAPKGNTGTTPLKRPAQPTRDVFLNPGIELINIDDGGYKFNVNYTPKPGENVFLELIGAGVYLNITGRFTREYFWTLLDLIDRHSLYSTAANTMPLRCRLLIGANAGDYPPPGTEYIRVLYPGISTPFGFNVNVSMRSYRTFYFPSPVLPIKAALGRGASALVPIGTSQPPLRYIMEGDDYAGRMLGQPNQARQIYYFIYGGKLECNPSKRGMDCTTYVMSCYRNREAASDGAVMCDNINADLVTGMDKVSPEAAKSHLENHNGNFIVLKWDSAASTRTSHVITCANKVIHQCTNIDMNNAYRSSALANYDFSGAVWSIHKMP